MSSIQETSAAPYAVAIAVGPGTKEPERLIDLAASVVAYESGPCAFVMIDDAPEPRHLDRSLDLPPSFKAISLHHPRHGHSAVRYTRGKGICSAIVLALQWTQANSDAKFVLKLDTDSLVINPFRQRLLNVFAAAPALGVVGAYTRTPNGTARDWSHHAAAMRQMLRPAFSLRHPLLALRWKPAQEHQPVVDLVDAAFPHGYDLAEHCMGGGYAVSRAMLDRAASAGYLADPSRWMPIDLPEDVMVGLHCRAVGMTMANSVGPGELFGVRYQGLPDSPEALAANGYAVIHAVKNDERYDEPTVRAFFAQRRAVARS